MTTAFIDETREQARRSDAAINLTDAQFSIAWDAASIMHRGIHRLGKFQEMLTDFSRAMADSDSVDATQAEFIIRDIYAERYGEKMNQTLEGLRENEARLREAGVDVALDYAEMVKALVREGETKPYYLAQDIVANDMVERFSITEAAAKSMMNEEHERATGRSLYEVGKELEREFHSPKREEARQARETAREPSRRHGPAMQR